MTRREVYGTVAVTKLKLIAKDEVTQKPLNEVLAEWLTSELQRPVSKAKARKLIIAGAVFLNGRRVTMASQRLDSETSIEARIDLEKLFSDSTSRDKAFELTPECILFEDENLIFIDKPPGLPAHPTADEARDNLVAAVGRFLSRRDGIAKPYLGVHHRLDRDTSGVMVFTKSERVNAAVAKSFSDHALTKIYQAIIVSRRDVRREWAIRNRLGKISSDSKRSRYGAVRSGGSLAETFFRVIAEYRRGIWIEAIPRTGRTHQIRVHLSEHGLPILGDDLYGSDDGLAPRLMLHASRLVLPHPITTREVSVESPVPEDFKRWLGVIR